MRDARDSWWIIASAAAALHGADIPVADVDLLASRRDAEALLTRLGLTGTSQPSDRFRSDLFARWTGLPLPIDIMAGFHVLGPDDWRELRPVTRIAIPLGDVTFPVPSIPELIYQCRLFARPKDVARAAILQRFGHEADMRPRIA
ncbi:hypothetical protein HZF05_12255 [Sphingomonas sp. CGMCC 1.13654]|uniref:Nucleotidyltransferase family protein n=1 Tax=Sphingomonas chungangi TaxID=2683589 RepID=A0A838L6A3_9SPHN|nr:hypothetical protein [Sphingomonas chungangi]MBA2934871.1 hypothetical protein [Sphingomonas chungangi]MVW58182.1 hypothetical protein [Sphingomonas chungangi]